MKDRLVEIYVGVGNGDQGTWFIVDTFVDPSLTSRKEIEDSALLYFTKDMDYKLRDSIAFMGIYSIWPDEEMEDFHDDDL